MPRNLAALGAFVLAGAVLWLVTAWPSIKDEDAPVPQPKAAQPAAPPPAPAAPAPQPIAAAPRAAEPEPEPEPAPHQVVPQAAPQLPEQITGDQGPVAEYRALFESEPRESDSAEIETKLRGSFLDTDGAPDLIKSVNCRRTICRLEMRWSMDRMRPYVAGLARAQNLFLLQLAVSPVSAKDSAGLRLVEVYLKRRAANEPAPEHQH